MGGDPTLAKQGGSLSKKALSPRLAKLEEDFLASGGEWREVAVGKLFNVVSGSQPDIHNRFSVKEDGMVNTITGATTRNGINFYSYSDVSFNHELTISKDGEYAGTVFLQTEPFIVGGHCMGMFAKEKMSDEVKIYIATLVNKVKPMWRGYDRPSVQKSRLEKLKIELPFHENKLAFSYMENYIKTLEAERIETLEAYLTVTGLRDYHLTEKDEKILDKFTQLLDTESRVEESGAFCLSPVKMSVLFPNIVQGRRLKRDDQIKGDLPFIMAGTSNTGVVGRIGNDVRRYPKHALTIDIFGNTFYRNYVFGAGDDTGVFWNEEIRESQPLLYLKTVIEKQLLGKYDFGHKLRSSQTYDFEFLIPTQKNQPDYAFMSDLIRVIEKLVIKDLVLWTDKRIEAAKEIVGS